MNNNDVLSKKMHDVINYVELSIDYINKNEVQVNKCISDNSYTITLDEILRILLFIKNNISNWILNYEKTDDIMCISLKNYKSVKEEAIKLVDNCLLIKGIYSDSINSILLYIGDELSNAIKTGGNINNINIVDIFTLFIDSINGMINDSFYKNDKQDILRLQELVLSWQKEYNKLNKLSLISNSNINEIFKSIVKICDKYKNIENEEDNYAEKIQYCYAKLEALRENEFKRMV